MNFGEAQAEFFARGFDYLSQDATGTARANRWINQAHQELCEMYDWPFMEFTTSGVTFPWTGFFYTPRKILWITNEATGGELEGRNTQDLAERYGDLTITGTASYYYLTTVRDTVTVNVYPVDASSTFTVRWIMTPVDNSDDAATFFPPSRFHDLIVDLAVLKAHKDADNFDTVAALRAEIDRRIADMVTSQFSQTLDSDPVISAIRGGEGDGTWAS